MLNTSRPTIRQGALGGGLGRYKFKCLGKLPNGWTDWRQIRYTSVDSSRNGHRLKHFARRYPTAAFGGGFRGSTTQKPVKCGEAVNLGMNTG